jgi:DNA-binding MarR family transcriptional regulator
MWIRCAGTYAEAAKRLTMFKDLDPLLHSQLRLSIMSLLMSVESAEFTFLRDKTQSTAGNLSVQIDKLSEAGYITVEKSFRGKRPLTTCKITRKGIKSFEIYVDTLKEYIGK